MEEKDETFLGMSNANFPLWLAKKQIEEAEKMGSYLDNALQRTKSRASNLLGWSIIIMASSIILLSSRGFQNHIPVLFMTISMMLIIIFCAIILLRKDCNIPDFSPVSLVSFFDENYVKTEIEALQFMAIRWQIVIRNNVEIVSYAQQLMRYIWFVFILTFGYLVLSIICF